MLIVGDIAFYSLIALVQVGLRNHGVAATPCESNPCQSYGTCVLTTDQNAFTCDCVKGTYGVNCEKATNLAFMKPTYMAKGPTQSSSNLVDGNTSGDMSKGSCSMTAKQDVPWFMVDLGEEYTIKKIILYNRDDCCSELLHNVVISVRKSYADNKVLPPSLSPKDVYCDFLSGPFSERKIISRCPNNNAIYGRFVVVNISTKNSTLQLCEVEVYGMVVPAGKQWRRDFLDKQNAAGDGVTTQAAVNALHKDAQSQKEQKQDSSTQEPAKRLAYTLSYTIGGTRVKRTVVVGASVGGGVLFLTIITLVTIFVFRKFGGVKRPESTCTLAEVSKKTSTISSNVLS